MPDLPLEAVPWRPLSTRILTRPRAVLYSPQDKLAYFKDNIATDEDDFDASQYYYNRHGSTGAPPGSGAERPAFHKYTYF